MSTYIVKPIDVAISISAEKEAESCFFKQDIVSGSREPVLMCHKDPSFGVYGPSLKLVYGI